MVMFIDERERMAGAVRLLLFSLEILKAAPRIGAQRGSIRAQPQKSVQN